MNDQAHFWRSVAAQFLPESVQIQACVSATGGFSGATVVRVETNAGHFALRHWPADFPIERIRELHRYLGELSRQALPVAVPLPHGSTRDTVLNVYGELWQLEPWLPGVPCRTAGAISDEQLINGARTLARMHVASSRYQCTPRGRRWFQCRHAPPPAASERRAVIARWDQQQLWYRRQQLLTASAPFQQLATTLLDAYGQQARQLDQELADCEKIAVALHPCWRDLWSDHILFTEDQVTGLIDPSATRTENVASDLSRWLGGLLENDQRRWQLALNAYATIRPLSPQEQQLIHTLERSSALLSGLTWIERWAMSAIPSGQLPAVCERLERLVERVRFC
ncbi:phosphotransferase [Planctomicrobium sp. SH664]|uniref:phosphotransferase n=1 Tax=Planctomicrobium sp. SH664 TaxID=3448125 RepID=UPI003F5C653B